mgnify:FL=1
MSISKIKTSIAPWINIKGCAKAIAFYQQAFGAVEAYHLEDPDGNIVSKLCIDDAVFWISDAGNDASNVNNCPVRMILTVDDPDNFFAKALHAGATEIFPVVEEHGWRVGRLADPFGYHWEVGKQTGE